MKIRNLFNTLIAVNWIISLLLIVFSSYLVCVVIFRFDFVKWIGCEVQETLYKRYQTVP